MSSPRIVDIVKGSPADSAGILVNGVLLSFNGEEIAKGLEGEPEGGRYLLSGVCLSQGKFLDGIVVEDLPREAEVVSAGGIDLMRTIGGGDG